MSEDDYNQPDDEYSQAGDEYGQTEGEYGQEGDVYDQASDGLGREEHDLNNEFDPGFDDPAIEIENEASQVASTPAKNIVVLAALGIGAVIFLYNMVFKEDEVTKEKEKIEEIIQEQPVENAVRPTQQEDNIDTNIGIVETPDLPTIEGLPSLPAPTSFDPPEISTDDFGGFEPEPLPELEPEPPEPEPAQEVVQAEPTPEPEPEPEPENEEPIAQPEIPQVVPQAVVAAPSPAEIAARKAARRKSQMLVMNGGGSPDPESAVGRDGVLSKTQLSKTSATQVTATYIGNLDVMIAQGKMIEAVLETAINSDLPGSLRAVISRDVYAESGSNVLIPKGSRLIGTYDNNIQRGQKRLVVTWSRVIRPDGVDIQIDSGGTDQLGRSGMSGIVDNKYFEIMGNSILFSIMTVVGSKIAEEFQTSQNISTTSTTTTEGDTSTNQTGTPTDLAVIEGVKNVSDVAKDIAQDFLDESPTIVVNQGARIKVFVNKDLIFPSSAVNQINYVN